MGNGEEKKTLSLNRDAEGGGREKSLREIYRTVMGRKDYFFFHESLGVGKGGGRKGD